MQNQIVCLSSREIEITLGCQHDSDLNERLQISNILRRIILPSFVSDLVEFAKVATLKMFRTTDPLHFWPTKMESQTNASIYSVLLAEFAFRLY